MNRITHAGFALLLLPTLVLALGCGGPERIPKTNTYSLTA